MSKTAMIVPIFTFLVLISSTAKGSLQITNHEYPLIHFTKLISEEMFTPGIPLVVVLPIGWGEDSYNKEVGYLIEEMHASGRWPILVHNVSYKMKGYMYTGIHPHGSYIILISGPCKEWEVHIIRFRRQLYELSAGDYSWYSWNPKAKFIVSVMSNCTNIENTKFSRALLKELWLREVMNAAVLFLKSKEHGGIYMQENTTDSAQGTYLEVHTWHPYENSDRCSPTEGNVPVKVFTVRNVSDIRGSDIFRGYDKNFQGCPFKVYVREMYPLVYPPKHFPYNDSYNQRVYEEGMEIEMLKVIGISLNMSLDIAGYEEYSSFVSTGNGNNFEVPKDQPFIFVGWYPGVNPAYDNFSEYTHSYLSVRLVWNTPCAVKYKRWSRFFNIFSVDMWIFHALSLVLAVITVRCISNYRHKSNLHESKPYSNIFSVTANIIAASLSVSVNTHPRSAPLRLFFVFWMCYSVAISTVFQAHITTFLIEPGYEKPIKTVEQMLNSDINFGLMRDYKILFPDTSDPVESAIVKNAVECPNEVTCFIWAAAYHNISTILNDFYMGIYRAMLKLIDENNRPILCEVENGVVRRVDLTILFRKRSPFFDFINDVISHIVEGGIFMHIKKRWFEKLEIQTQFNFPTSDEKYFAFGVSHLQTAFYLLMLGYVFAVACFVTEIMWHFYKSKGCVRTRTSLCYR
jgi:hypothetical protein